MYIFFNLVLFKLSRVKNVDFSERHATLARKIIKVILIKIIIDLKQSHRFLFKNYTF